MVSGIALFSSKSRRVVCVRTDSDENVESEGREKCGRVNTDSDRSVNGTKDRMKDTYCFGTSLMV